MKEEKIKEKTTNKVRTSLVRKQNVIFVAMVIVGLSLTIKSQFADSRLLSEGIAFIIVGFVGMLMSWTTMDIGASIKEAIYDVGASIKEAIYDVGTQHANALESIASSQKEIKDILNTHTDILQNDIASSQKEIKDILNTHTDILQNDIAKSQKEIKDILQNDIAKSQKEIKDILQNKD